MRISRVKRASLMLAGALALSVAGASGASAAAPSSVSASEGFSTVTVSPPQGAIASTQGTRIVGYFNTEAKCKSWAALNTGRPGSGRTAWCQRTYTTPSVWAGYLTTFP